MCLCSQTSPGLEAMITSLWASLASQEICIKGKQLRLIGSIKTLGVVIGTNFFEKLLEL